MVIKEDMERNLRNTNMKPWNHSSYLQLHVLCQCFWDVEEKLFLLNDLTLGDLKSFIPELLSQDYSEMSLAYRPSHADFTYDLKVSIQGDGRSSARETIGRVAAGAVAKKILHLHSGTEKKQNTVTRDKHDTELIAKGRHDPCVVPRGKQIGDDGGSGDDLA